MARLALLEWRTPPPTSIDEALVVYDDGSVVLVVRSPRDAGATIGSYAARPAADDVERLATAGPAARVLDPLHPVSAEVDTDLAAVAERVAALARMTPHATVTFHAHATAADGTSSATLLAVGAGAHPVVFELEPDACSLQVADGTGQPIGWQPLPELLTGFVTPDAAGLGGLRRVARIAPGQYGAIAFETSVSAVAAQVGIVVGGWLHDALPDEPTPARFTVRTALVPIGRGVDQAPRD